MSLLSKTRELNTLLQKHKGIAVDFKDVAQTISSVTVTNVFIVSRRGKILGSSLNELLKSDRIINMLEERHIPTEYTEQLMDVKQTQSNIDIDNVLTVFLLKIETYLKIVEQQSSNFRWRRKTWNISFRSRSRRFQ